MLPRPLLLPQQRQRLHHLLPRSHRLPLLLPLPKPPSVLLLVEVHTALAIKYALVDAVGGRIGFANNNNGWTTVGQTSTSGRWGDYQGNYPQRVDLSTGLLHSPSDRTPITGCQSYVTCTKGSNLSLNCQDEATGTLNTFYSCPASDGVLVAYLFTASAPPSPGCTIRTDMVVSGL
jgi:hypothetical protein